MIFLGFSRFSTVPYGLLRFSKVFHRRATSLVLTSQTNLSDVRSEKWSWRVLDYVRFNDDHT